MNHLPVVYGQALFDLALEERLEERLLEELEAVCALFGEEPRYIRLLSLPDLPKADRRALLDESLGGRVHPYLLNFLKLLLDRRALPQLPACRDAYLRAYRLHAGILPVTAVTAVPLKPAQLQALEAKLTETTGKRIQLTTRLDPSVLGGVRLELPGKQLDGTLRARLDGLQTALRRMVL